MGMPAQGGSPLGRPGQVTTCPMGGAICPKAAPKPALPAFKSGAVRTRGNPWLSCAEMDYDTIHNCCIGLHGAKLIDLPLAVACRAPERIRWPNDCPPRLHEQIQHPSRAKCSRFTLQQRPRRNQVRRWPSRLSRPSSTALGFWSQMIPPNTQGHMLETWPCLTCLAPASGASRTNLHSDCEAL